MKGQPGFFDIDERYAALSEAGDSKRLGRIVSAITLVDIGPLDLASGQLLRFRDHRAQGVAVIGIAGQRLGVQHELAALQRRLVVVTVTLTPNS